MLGRGAACWVIAVPVLQITGWLNAHGLSDLAFFITLKLIFVEIAVNYATQPESMAL